MRIPFSWLKDFVEISETPEQVEQKLRDVGVPVERIETLSPGITGVVSGSITRLERHPNADKLRVAEVNLSDRTLQIITGAPNVSPGDIIPVALVGAHLAQGKVIQESKLRGLPSYGMMCSADELDLGVKEFLPPAQAVGVMILDPDTKIGMDLSSVLLLNEAVFVVEPFANRPDFLSVFGVAREIAAAYGIPLKLPLLASPGHGDLGVVVKIEDYQGCSRYTARMVNQIKVKPSPLWMAVRLHAAGVRPINNVVDITNYVMLEVGQPLHAFSASLISGKAIQVRRAKAGEKIIAIDGKTYDLSPSDLVIADDTKPTGIAGIMGSKGSEIADETTDVLLEAATFNSGTIRRTSQRLGLRTESSKRFERNLDPEGAVWGNRRACYLLEKAGGVVSEGFVDVHEKLPPRVPIAVRFNYTKSLLGLADLTPSMMERILTGLGFEYEPGEPARVISPLFRLDIREEADIIEEVARHYGYDRIPSTLPRGATTPASIHPDEAFEEALRDLLRSTGLTEVITYSLGDPSVLDKFKDKPLVNIQNPLTEDRKALRPFLYPGALFAIRKNLHVKSKDLALFEIGKVFHKNSKLSESRHCCIALSGKLPWGKEVTFFVLKGILEQLWNGLHVQETLGLTPLKHPHFHPHRYASIGAGASPIGFLGEIHPLLLENFDIDQRVYLLEISLDALQPLHTEAKFLPLPIYPESRRDLSMIVKEELPAGKLVELVKREGGKWVEEVTIFDVYQGPQVPEKHKSLALAITYRAQDKTLTEEEVNSLHGKIQNALQTEAHATLRI